MPHSWVVNCVQGPHFRSLTTNLRKTYEKVWLTKNLGWACESQHFGPHTRPRQSEWTVTFAFRKKKSYNNLMKNWGRSYAKLMKNLQRHYRYKNVKKRGKWCHSRNLLSKAVIIEYFELEITDNQIDDFLRMLSKNGLPFS